MARKSLQARLRGLEAPCGIRLCPVIASSRTRCLTAKLRPGFCCLGGTVVSAVLAAMADAIQDGGFAPEYSGRRSRLPFAFFLQDHIDLFSGGVIDFGPENTGQGLHLLRRQADIPADAAM